MSKNKWENLKILHNPEVWRITIDNLQTRDTVTDTGYSQGPWETLLHIILRECLPLCACWLVAQEASHPLSPAGSWAPNQPPAKRHTHVFALKKNPKHYWRWRIFNLTKAKKTVVITSLIHSYSEIKYRFPPWPWGHTPLGLQAESYWTSRSQL